MGKQIIKVSPDRDLYMEWSSVVEAPTWIGDRASTLDYLVDDFRPGTDRYTFERSEAEKRLARADETGSSGHPPFGCDWTDWGEIYQQQGCLPRRNFVTFAERILQSSFDVDVADLLDPFEDDDLVTSHIREAKPKETAT